MPAAPLVALDLGSTKVACAVGRLGDEGGELEVLGTGIVAYSRPSDAWLGDPLTAAAMIEQALEATGVSAEWHRAWVTFHHPALATDQVQTSIDLADEPIVIRAHDLERLKARALDLALGVDREPLVMERLACAGNGFEALQDPQGLSATRLVGTFHLVTMPMAVRRAIVQAVESAGLEIAQLSLGLSAMMASVGAQRERHQRVLFIELGGMSSDLGLFVDGRLHALRTLRWGGVELATAVAKACQLTMEQAVTVSLEGLASRRAPVRELLEHRLGDVAQAAQALLAHAPRPDQALIGGRMALLDGVVEWLEQATQLPIALARHPRTQQVSDLGRQMALCPALGLLAMAAEREGAWRRRAPRPVGRLLERTRELLTEYF
ncbi:MAG: hypothetical protein HY601_01700 [Candidatus Omnitrophica bacterium]|nr:hypothetical protein [Candidatus Omnitrophota bacterium]